MAVADKNGHNLWPEALSSIAPLEGGADQKAQEDRKLTLLLGFLLFPRPASPRRAAFFVGIRRPPQRAGIALLLGELHLNVLAIGGSDLKERVRL